MPLDIACHAQPATFRARTTCRTVKRAQSAATLHVPVPHSARPSPRWVRRRVKPRQKVPIPHSSVCRASSLSHSPGARARMSNATGAHRSVSLYPNDSASTVHEASTRPKRGGARALRALRDVRSRFGGAHLVLGWHSRPRWRHRAPLVNTPTRPSTNGSACRARAANTKQAPARNPVWCAGTVATNRKRGAASARDAPAASFHS